MKTAFNLWIFDGCVNEKDDLVTRLDLAGKTNFKNADMSLHQLDYAGSAMLSTDWRKWAEKIKIAADKNGIKLIQAHSSDSTYETGVERDRTVEIIKREIEICGILGIPQIVVHSVFKSGNTWKQFRMQNKHFYESLIDTAEKHNVNILLENSCFQNCRGMYYYTTAEFLLTTIDDLGAHPFINVCWDTGHAHMQGSNQYAELTELGGRLKGLHAHDNWGDRDTHAMLFTGSCGFDVIISALLDINYEGYFTLEDCAITPSNFARRPGYDKKDGSKKLADLPADILLQGTQLSYEITKYMLTQYDCFEE